MLNYIFGYLWEPAAAHTKWAFLGLAIMSGQLTFCVLVLAMFVVVLPGILHVFHLASGFRSLKVLAERMRKSGSTPWIKVEPYSRDDLINKFGLIQYNVPLNRNWSLFLIKKDGSTDMNHYCYINALSNVYIETVNADANFENLPAAQKYMIYHELAHSSFLGGEYWVTQRAEFLFVPITLGVLVVFLDQHASSFLFAPVAILAFAVMSHATRLYRNTTSEQVADRLALRWICREDPELAIRIGQMKIRRWDASLESNADMDWKDRRLTMERRKAMEQFVRTIRDWRDGKTTIDPDRIPWPLRLPFHFLLAVFSLSLILVWGSAPSSDQTATLSWLMGTGFLFLMLVGSYYKVKQTRLDGYIQSRFKDVKTNDDIS